MYTEKDFIDEALALYPSLRARFEELDDLFHLQMGAFENRVTEAIRDRKDTLVRQSFFLAEKCYRQGTEGMKSAVDVSFVEGVLVLLDKESKAWGWSKMPYLLRELYLRFWCEFESQ